MLDTALTVSACDSFAAPEPMPDRLTVCTPASSRTVTSEIAAAAGASLTAAISTVIVPSPESTVPSLTRNPNVV